MLRGPGPAVTEFDPYFANVTLLLPLASSDATNYGSTGGSMTLGSGGSTGWSSVQSKWGLGSYFCDGASGYGTLTNSQTAYGIEGWFYTTSHGAYGGFLAHSNDIAGGGGTDRGWNILFNNTGNTVWMNCKRNAVNTNVTTETSAITLNQWNHIAVTRNSSNLMTTWVNGTSLASTTTTFTDFFLEDGANRPMKIGQSRETFRSHSVYINDVRITQGVCRYTGSFTPPVAPFPRQ
jgi:hypothetical protein